MSRTRKRTSNQIAAEFGLAGVHTLMTLWYRLPMFTASFASAGMLKPEFSRMVSEKAAAVFEGVIDAQLETLRIAGDAATGQLQVTDLTTLPVQVAAAGLRPAFRRVKANSRRLHRNRRPRS